MGNKSSGSPSKSKSDKGSGSPNASNGASPRKLSPLPNGSNSSPSKPKPPPLQSPPPPPQPKNRAPSAPSPPAPTPSSKKDDSSASPNRTKQSQTSRPKLAPSTGKPSQSSFSISQLPLNPPSSSPPPPFKGSPPSGSKTSGKPSPPYRKSSAAPKKGFGAPTESGSFRRSPPSSPVPAKSNSKLTRPSNTSSSNSTSGGGFQNTGKYVGYALAGVFFVALVAVVLVFALKRKRERTEYTACMPPDRFPVKPDGHHYGRYPGIVKRFYGNSPLGKMYGNASHRGAMHQLETGPKFAQTVFSFEDIKKITNGFSQENVIGEGGFGNVYKGWLRDGRVVAVKQLKAGSRQGEREFRAEVEVITRVHHRHLVSLVGYCMSRKQRVLIYEFVPNKTLDHHLHGRGMPVLAWTKRMKIAIGAAKGLAYLHEDCYPKIIHRDIKSANILLDDSFKAQVADFGLAKLHDGARTSITTRVVGTFGYMAPEYATSGKLTDRSDVFSFGVVLLELITGRKPVDRTQPLGDESLVEWARSLLNHSVETGDCSELVDPRLEKNFVEREMCRMVEVAAACIRHSAPLRPSMAQVARALDNGDLSDLSNGLRYGDSVVYDSGQYNEDIRNFRRRNNSSCGSSEYDMDGEECNSAELYQYGQCLGSSCESERQAFKT